MNMRELYQQFNGATSINDIQKLLADIKEEVQDQKEPETEGVEDTDPSNSELEDKLNLASLGLDQLSEYLNKIQAEIDKTALPGNMASAADGLVDYKTAYDRTTFYTKIWFSRSFMSIEGKAQFAGYLIDLVKPYCQSNLETWRMIASGDPDMTTFISYPRED